MTIPFLLSGEPTMDYMKDLLLNLLALLITMLIFQVILVDKYKDFYDKHRFKILAYIAILQIILSMTFTIELHNEFKFDFRLIPVLLGGLYGGHKFAIGLFLFVVLLRIPFGGAGIINTLIVFLLVTIVSIFLSSAFKKMDTSRKLLVVTFLCVFFSLFSFVTPVLFMGFRIDPYFIIMFSITQTLGILVITYSSELIIKNSLLFKAILKTEKMEVVSHLAASISHEVRNPLTVTRGFLQMLKDPNIGEEKRKYYLDTALEELDRAEVIISDYLTFAKPHPHDLDDISIKDLIQKGVDLITPYANHYSVQVKQEIADHAYIVGDATKLQQCLINIFKNSIEAMPQGGTLEIYTEVLYGHCIIHIVDNGIGMTNEQITRLGEPYFSTKEGKGTGLGMMVVFRIIEGIGGSIKVRSQVGKGTHFEVSLPSTKEKKPTTSSR